MGFDGSRLRVNSLGYVSKNFSKGVRVSLGTRASNNKTSDDDRTQISNRQTSMIKRQGPARARRPWLPLLALLVGYELGMQEWKRK